jgi:hypothetical protein
MIFINFLFKAVFKPTIENISGLFSYISTGRVNIRTHRDVTGEIWFGVD